MQVEVITPESKIFTGEAQAVQLPGLDGLFQVLNNHAPIISALKSGQVKIDLLQPLEMDEDTNAAIELVPGSKNAIQIAIHGGVAEMMNNRLIVLAE